jgi:hypothetical protein
MQQSVDYPIGAPGTAWTEHDKALWLVQQSVKRSFANEVEAKLDTVTDYFHVERYGELTYVPARYPLFVLKSKQWDHALPNILITGGVHGYETSGVQGAIRFAQTQAANFASQFNLVILPCVSPWGYETINRWNPLAIDPNRAFVANSPAEEAAAAMAFLESLSISFLAHFDLHETTDTDNTEFRPALAARDAIFQKEWEIPDGFYTVGDTARPAVDFLTAIINSVKAVTHIAPAIDGKIIGEELQQHGVINYDVGALGLCAGMTSARFVTTTEVYPDSPQSTPENCIQAQVAAITGGLSYLIDQLRNDRL